MFWKVLLQAISFYAGTFYAGFGVVGPMICVNFALPATKRLIRANLIVDGRAVKLKYTLPVIFWACVNAAVLFLIHLLLPNYLLAFGIGLLWTGFTGLGRSGANEANTQEYFETIARYAINNDEKTIEEIVATALKE